MYELVIANKNYSSWSMRPWVLMRTQGIAFTERLLPFHLNHGEGDFRRFSPSGRVPCLVDGALRVWDSLAITEYLARAAPGCLGLVGRRARLVAQRLRRRCTVASWRCATAVR